MLFRECQVVARVTEENIQFRRTCSHGRVTLKCILNLRDIVAGICQTLNRVRRLSRVSVEMKIQFSERREVSWPAQQLSASQVGS